jgi:hypothetical protein
MKNCFLCFENASTQDKKREGILFNFAQEGILYSGQDSKNDANRIGLVLGLDNGKLKNIISDYQSCSKSIIRDLS